MRVDNINSYNTNFNGIIKNTELLQKHIQHEITRGDETMLFPFFNTLKAIKKDPATDEFILEKINGKTLIKYGSEEKICDKEANVIDEIIDMGREIFGLEKIYGDAKEINNAYDTKLQAVFLEEEGTEASQQKAKTLNEKATKLLNNAFQSLLG